MCTDHRVPAALFAVSLVALGPFATAVAAQHTPPNKTGACASPGEGDGVNMVFTPGGNFTMGSDRHRPEERYTHVVSLDGFWIDRTEVTNAQFGKFVAATGYVTLAERGGDPKVHVNMPKQFLEAGSVVFIKPTDVSSGGSVTQWFQYVSRADWRHPEGPGTSIAAREDHPVVHVAYEDAMAYARWLGHSLPTEAQWEYAARGGRDGEDDLSSAFDADGKPTANTWQVFFPSSIPRTMATPAPHLSGASGRTATDYMT